MFVFAFKKSSFFEGGLSSVHVRFRSRKSGHVGGKLSFFREVLHNEDPRPKTEDPRKLMKNKMGIMADS